MPIPALQMSHDAASQLFLRRSGQPKGCILAGSLCHGQGKETTLKTENTHTHIYIYIFIYLCIYLFMYVFIHLFIYLFVCYTYIYIIYLKIVHFVTLRVLASRWDGRRGAWSAACLHLGAQSGLSIAKRYPWRANTIN
jgi:hypothetical protein